MAHNKLLDHMSKETMLSVIGEFRRFIREAVVKFDEENCLEEVGETLQAIADQRKNIICMRKRGSSILSNNMLKLIR